MRTRFKTLAACIATAVLCATAAPTLAGHWQWAWKRPNAYVTFNDNAVNAEFQYAVRHINAYYWSPYTDLHLARVTSYGEIRYVDGYWGDTGWAGQAVCKDWNGSRCGWVQVRFNKSYGPYSTWQKRHLACHETGHAVGLGHSGRTTSCMHTGWHTATPDGHDYEAINNHY